MYERAEIDPTGDREKAITVYIIDEVLNHMIS